MPEQLLFIGHSLVGYKMPEMFNSFMNTLGIDAQADRQVINGSPLRYNWDNGSSAEGVNARAVLPSGAYDSVIITEALPLDEHIRWNDTQGYADRYYDLARSANPDTRFYIYETWHDISGNGAAWRAQIDADLHKWEGIADYINGNAPNGAIPTMIVPAGQAMAKLYDAIQAGQVPGISSIMAVFDDTIHLNDLGNWFMAALQAATVLGIDPASLPSDTFGRWGNNFDGPNAALKSALSDVISDTLAEYDRDGRDGALQPVADQQDSYPVPDPEPVPDPVPSPGGMNFVYNVNEEETHTGGDGLDTWDAAGIFEDFAFSILGDGRIVIGNDAFPNSSDTLIDIERLLFSDGTLAFDTDGSAGQAYRLYQAAFDRTPDAEGLGFWIDHFDDGNVDLVAMAGHFMASEEFAMQYGNPDTLSDRSFLDLLYANVLDRTSDQAGFDFWSDQQVAGLNRPEMLQYFSESTENYANVAEDIDRGIFYL